MDIPITNTHVKTARIIGGLMAQTPSDPIAHVDNPDEWVIENGIKVRKKLLTVKEMRAAVKHGEADKAELMKRRQCGPVNPHLRYRSA